jgi:hypothetical protein
MLDGPTRAMYGPAAGASSSQAPTAAFAHANAPIAERLREAAELLDEQGANPFRGKAYRRAAENLERLDGDVRELFDEGGVAALEALDGIGPGIAAAIGEMLVSGRWGLLERLRTHAEPAALFRLVPGIGPELAQRIHDALHIDTLEALEMAAYDGRLASVPGLGARRVSAIRAALAALLKRRTPAPRPPAPGQEPPVDVVLDVDREYRERAAHGTLPTIVPRRFNADGRARLPILHAHRGAWHFTLLFSNTPRAHELRRTRDWVVVYYYNEDHEERQCTVVTETSGALAGCRVVRGREDECRQFYGRTRERLQAIL